ncbi:hypothetical protein BWI96_03605 [Siphonobacter sp. SORGH_AS_0500]|uniref:RagB/SusD family nutrient uptake outer membrane protein n=1 Tax=Siphonobacter sp. SORGH_AS_0500 TaxID=1864824 RepID=UPI000CAD0222|nr:RagB/SusD family nutrient uptake outer membrane protein [Siphonobacter sp. SORGH_AS_0500]PKK38170.1 hypothetical protein BWI96_03605 [Siphonobacter sp. SORGH_AS_0500]
MKTLKILYGLGLTGLMVFNQSCTNLDSTVYDQADAGTFPATESDLNSVIGSSYGTLRSFVDDPFVLQETTTDEVVVPTRGPDWYDDGRWQQLAKHQFTPLIPTNINGAWEAFYRSIANVNINVATLKASSLASKQTTIAELRAIRALNYYYLVDLFGNVPILTEDSPAGNPVQSPRVDVYNFIVKELKEAIPQMRNESSITMYGRMSRGAGHALLAHVYLNAEVFMGTPRWTEASAECDSVINSKLYSLSSNFLDNFAVNNDKNGSMRENIFVIPYDKTFATGNTFQLRTLHYALQQKYGLANSPWNGYCTYADFYSTFSDQDARKKMWLAGPQTGSDGKVIQYDDRVDGLRHDVNFTPEISALERALAYQGVRFQKFEIQTGNLVTSQDNDFPIFRYSSVLMAKAEALVRLGKAAEALSYINQVRKRAGVSDFTTADLTLDNLLKEYGREFAFEGRRRTDLIRFKSFTQKAWQFKPVTDSKYNLMPIPSVQISSNPNLKQNPGYN